MIENDIYMPEFEDIKKFAGLPDDALNQDAVTIPTKLFKFLLSVMLEGVAFDEAAYRRSNSDLADAERKGNIESLHQHFIGTGWFEGRSPGEYQIDEAWYAMNYRDVAVALRRGLIKDLKQHFNETGRREGPVGSAEQSKWKERWESVLSKAPARAGA